MSAHCAHVNAVLVEAMAQRSPRQTRTRAGQGCVAGEAAHSTAPQQAHSSGAHKMEVKATVALCAAAGFEGVQRAAADCLADAFADCTCACPAARAPQHAPRRTRPAARALSVQLATPSKDFGSRVLIRPSSSLSLSSSSSSWSSWSRADTRRLCQQAAGYAALSGRASITLNDVQGALEDAQVHLGDLERYLDHLRRERTAATRGNDAGAHPDRAEWGRRCEGGPLGRCATGVWCRTANRPVLRSNSNALAAFPAVLARTSHGGARTAGACGTACGVQQRRAGVGRCWACPGPRRRGAAPGLHPRSPATAAEQARLSTQRGTV